MHGYSAGRLTGDASGEGSLRLWPRVATKSKDGVCRIGPDRTEFELQGDGGTAPELVAGRQR